MNVRTAAVTPENHKVNRNLNDSRNENCFHYRTLTVYISLQTVLRSISK